MAPERRIPATRRPQPTRRREISLRLARLGARQKHLLRLEQIATAGLSERAARNRVASGDLFRIHRGVFALHSPPYSPHQLYLAAAYACGRESAICDLPAAWLQGMSENRPAQVHVANSSGSGRGLAGIVVHRRELDGIDVELRYGIPCTTPERTIFDCAASVSIETLEELLMAADSGQPGLDRPRLNELVANNRGRRGVRNLRELISDDPSENDSINELRMLRLCRRFGVPKPQTQYEITAEGRTYRADFCWPKLRLIVECDSWRWHGGKLKTESDRDRDQRLTIGGWVVVHFTRNQIKLSPERTGERLVALLAGRRAALSR